MSKRSAVFVTAARPIPPEAEGVKRARSASEAFLYRRLETSPETRGRFQLNVDLPIPFDGFGRMEIDLICADSRVVVEIDGGQKEAKRRNLGYQTLINEVLAKHVKHVA